MNFFDYAVWPTAIAVVVVYLIILDQLAVIDLDVIGWLRDNIPCRFCRHYPVISFETCKAVLNTCNWDRRKERACCRCKYGCYRIVKVEPENHFIFKRKRGEKANGKIH